MNCLRPQTCRTVPVAVMLTFALWLHAAAYRTAYAQPSQGAPSEADRAAVAAYNRGVDLTAEGRLKEAVAAFTRAIELHPRFARAYCDRGLTAAGVPSGVGQCAAPADIPFGAQIYIPALGRTFVVTDRTAKRFRHNTVDLFIRDRRECLKFGRRYLKCEITLPAETVRYGSPRLLVAAAAVRQ